DDDPDPLAKTRRCLASRGCGAEVRLSSAQVLGRPGRRARGGGRGRPDHAARVRCHASAGLHPGARRPPLASRERVLSPPPTPARPPSRVALGVDSTSSTARSPTRPLAPVCTRPTCPSSVHTRWYVEVCVALAGRRGLIPV